MNKKILIIIIILLIITNCLNFGILFNNKKDIENFGGINTTVDTIKEQINKIYKTDIQSIRNLSEIAQKLQGQQGKNLILPGNFTIEGNLNTTKNVSMGPIKTNKLVLSGKDILYELNQLNSKIKSLESNQNNLVIKHHNSTGQLNNLNNNVKMFELKFPDKNTLILGPNKIYSSDRGFQFGSKDNNLISCYAYAYASNVPHNMHRKIPVT